MTEIKAPTWEDVRRVRDELKAKMQHASTEVKERWAKLQPSIKEAEDTIKSGGSVVVSKLQEIGSALKDIGRDVADKLDLITHDKDAPKTDLPKTDLPKKD
jgi:hypothetical protein